MVGTFFLVATAVLGIEVGWEPDERGETEYVIQIEPELVPSMVEGTPIRFTVRPEHQGVRLFRFQVGRGPVPQVIGEVPPPWDNAVAEPPAQQTPPIEPPVNVQPEPPAAEQGPGAMSPLEYPSPPDNRAAEDPVADVRPPDPGILPNNPNTLPIRERKAGYEEPTAGPRPAGVDEVDPPEDETSSAPLIVASSTAVGLAAALVYLCWIHLGTRRRYRELLAEYYAAVGSIPSSAAPAGLPMDA